MKKIVIILPTFNEKDNIEEMIKRVLQEKANVNNWELHILVSDSHSPDGTGDKVEKIAQKNSLVHLLDVKERGIGVGLVRGYQFSFDKLGADAVIQMDADLQHDPAEIPKFLKALDEGYDVVQGSRFIKGGENRLEWYRRLFSWGANFVSKALMGVWNMHEFTASYRGFTKEVYQKINFDKVPWRGTSFLFQPAFLYAASLVSRRMKEIPIIFVDRRRGYSKMQIVNYIKDLTLFALKIRLEKSKRFLEFLVVGGIGFIINAILLALLVEKANFYPATANLIAAEAAIISNFIWNNLWTFQERKIVRVSKIAEKLFQFNLTSAFGVVIIQTGVIWLGTILFGRNLYILYFLIGTAFLLIWNFTVYNRLIWKKAV